VKLYNIAVIPARGGSKRIPRKNIKYFCGKPIIAYSIQVAKECGCFDKVIVSTDDQEIADISKQYGADVPFLRPSDLSDDYCGTTDVIKHAIEFLQENQNQNPDFICCIYPTSPFLTIENIILGLDKILTLDCNFSFSVTRYSYPIQRAVHINKNGMMDMINPEEFNTRSQDLKDVFHDVGQFYWGDRISWLEETIFSNNSSPIVLPNYRALDIDTLEDWKYAELMFNLLKNMDNM
jgi:pseudaminic acid cytidylyltransferase